MKNTTNANYRRRQQCVAHVHGPNRAPCTHADCAADNSVRYKCLRADGQAAAEAAAAPAREAA